MDQKHRITSAGIATINGIPVISDESIARGTVEIVQDNLRNQYYVCSPYHDLAFEHWWPKFLQEQRTKGLNHINWESWRVKRDVGIIPKYF